MIDKSLLKRESSRTGDGKIACSLPPSLERNQGWQQESSQRRETSPLRRSQEADRSKNHSEDSIRDMMFNLRVGLEKKPEAPTEFDEAEWKAAAEANPKPSTVLETTHGYSARVTKNHSEGSVRKLMQLIAPQSKRDMFSSVETLPNVPESQDLVGENPEGKNVTNVAPNSPVAWSMDEKVSLTKNMVDPFDATTELNVTSGDADGATKMEKLPGFDKASKQVSVFD